MWCRGYTKHHPKVSILRRVDKELLWKETQEQRDSIRTVDTASTTSSFSELDNCPTTRKGCLKIKTQEDSLLHTIIPSGHAKSVHYSTVDIHVHAIRLGDNPSISDHGPPLTISWDYEASFSMDLDEYQDLREEDGIRHLEELRVPSVVRMEWLDQEGFSFGEMMKEQAKALRIGCKRRESIKECVQVEERKELVRRKFQKWVLRKSDAHPLQEWKKQQSCQAAA